MTSREEKLTVMKSLRMSEVLPRMIADECKTRNLGFSDYMRDAAIAAMKQHISDLSGGMSEAGGSGHKPERGVFSF